MGLQDRKASRDIKKATQRLERLKELQPNLTRQKDFTLENYEELLRQTVGKMHEYNASLANARKLRHELMELEKKLADYNERAFKAIITQFGRDSDEYAYVGGTKKSEFRKRKK